MAQECSRLLKYHGQGPVHSSYYRQYISSFLLQVRTQVWNQLTRLPSSRGNTSRFRDRAAGEEEEEEEEEEDDDDDDVDDEAEAEEDEVVVLRQRRATCNVLFLAVTPSCCGLPWARISAAEASPAKM